MIQIFRGCATYILKSQSLHRSVQTLTYGTLGVDGMRTIQDVGEDKARSDIPELAGIDMKMKVHNPFLPIATTLPPVSYYCFSCVVRTVWFSHSFLVSGLYSHKMQACCNGLL